MANMKKTTTSIKILAILFIGLTLLVSFFDSFEDSNIFKNKAYNDKVFKIISSSENKPLELYIRNYFAKEKVEVDIEFEDTLKIMKKINKGEKYDAVWVSNSIWLYMINNSKVSITNSKSTSINPVIFGIKKSKAESLGFINKEVYTKDIVDAIKSGKLKFSMSNPTTTNSGASAYLGILSTLAGNPEVLTESMLENQKLKDNLKSFFSGLERSSGNEDFLEELFLNGEYDAVFSYESSIININKKLEESGKETLYAIYPVDGVSVSDSPIAYMDNKNENKKNIFDKFQSYLLSNEGQKLLSKHGRRTWYGGINKNADKTIFNPKWGIDTTTYITPTKYPSTAVIKKALALYQTELRKPIHVVFCLDYSGSMYGDGINQLRDAMDYILTDRAEEELLQFTSEDKIDIIAFETDINDVWSTKDGSKTQDLLNKINSKEPNGSTALYKASIKAIELLRNEDSNKYNVSVILMTDGNANVGSFSQLKSAYNYYKKDIPIYSITFGNASQTELTEIAELTNAKVFDGRENLIDAFKEVTGYN